MELVDLERWKPPAGLCGLELARLGEALEQRLRGGRVQDVMLGRDGDLVVALRAARNNFFLRLGCLHEAQWLFADAAQPPLARAGSPLRDQARSVLTGAALEEIACCAEQREVRFRFSAPGGLFTLLFHAALPARTIALLDAGGTVLTSVGVPRPPSTSERRPAPAPGSAAPLRALLDATPGLSRELAAWILAAAERSGDATAFVRAAVATLRAGELDPGLVRDAAARAVRVLPSAAWAPPHLRWEPHATYDGAVAAFWRERLRQLTSDRLRGRVAASLRRAHKRCVNTARVVEAELAAHQARLGTRTDADLLAAHFHLLRRGADSVEVVDYADPAQRTRRIPLDPALTPRQNLEQAYKQAQRAERGVQQAGARLTALRAEQAALAAQLACAETADDETLRALAASLRLHVDRLPHAADRAPQPRAAPPAPGVRLLIAPSGHEVYVGKSAAGNDTILRRFARGNDWWLHAEGVAGAHVVVRRRGRDDIVPQATLELAAVVAATLSDSKQDTRAAVALTQVKYVRKRRGDPPGKVTYSQERTLLVTPDPRVFERFENKDNLPPLI